MKLLPPTADVRAHRVVGRKLRTPRVVRKGDDGVREVEHDDPGTEVPDRRRGGRYEQHVDRQQQQRNAADHPRLASSPARARAVGPDTDQRIGERVGESSRENDNAHGVQADAEFRVERQHVQVHRKQRHGDRQVERAVAQNSRFANFFFTHGSLHNMSVCASGSVFRTPAPDHNREAVGNTKHRSISPLHD